MSPEQRNLIRQLALLAERDHREGATAASIPIDREILGIDLFDEGRPVSMIAGLRRSAGARLRLVFLGRDARLASARPYLD